MGKLLLKTLLGIAVIIVLGVVLLVTFISPIIDESSQLQFQKDTEFEHQKLLVLLEGMPFEQWAERIAAQKNRLALMVALVKAEGESNDALEPFYVKADGAGRFFLDEEDNYIAFYDVLKPGWRIRFQEDEDSLTELPGMVNAIQLLVIGPLLIILLAMLLGTAYLLYNFSRPIRALEAAMVDLSINSGTRLGGRHMTVFPYLSKAFNDMAGRLETTLTEQQVTIAAIPHELRTPIARIRFALDMLRGRSGQSLMLGVERLDGYVEELQELVEAILELSLMERQEIVHRSLDMQELLEECCTACDTQQTFNLHVETDRVETRGHRALLQRALTNLLDNACQYSHEWISVRLYRVNEQLAIDVENDGAQLLEQDVASLFQPFYRADSSRSRSSGGLGIGLTLVDKIIKKHQGRVSAELMAPDVLRITLLLPAS